MTTSTFDNLLPSLSLTISEPCPAGASVELQAYWQAATTMNHNNAWAQMNIGWCFHYGKHGVSQNYIRAVHWYKKASAKKHPGALLNLGICYEMGHGVGEKDLQRAAECYQQAVKLSDEQEQRRKRKQQTKSNNLQALSCQSSSTQTLAHFQLGRCYDYGLGVPYQAATAVKHYEVAAHNMYGPAMLHLGILCKHGAPGLLLRNGRYTGRVPRDLPKAKYWLRTAARVMVMDQQQLHQAQEQLQQVEQLMLKEQHQQAHKERQERAMQLKLPKQRQLIKEEQLQLEQRQQQQGQDQATSQTAPEVIMAQSETKPQQDESKISIKTTKGRQEENTRKIHQESNKQGKKQERQVLSEKEK